MGQHARTNIFDTGNSANENSISDIENSDILDNSLEVGNSQIQENPENCEGLELCEDPSVILSHIRKENLNRHIIGHINIIFLESKFEAIKLIIEDKLDILVVTET